MSDTTTARCPVPTCPVSVEGVDKLSEHLYDAHSALALAMNFAKARNRVLTDAAELIRQHRGDLDDDNPWWDTRDRDTAIAVLLTARTNTTSEATVRGCPSDDSVLTACCARTAFELPRFDRLCMQCQHTEAEHDRRNGYCTRCEAQRELDICHVYWPPTRVATSQED
jgi:hypothetical protein